MYQIIVDAYWPSESLYDEYNSYSDAQNALDKLVTNDVYERDRLCIVTKWQGGNTFNVRKGEK